MFLVTGALPHVSVTENQLQGLYPTYLLLTTSYRGSVSCTYYQQPVTGALPHVPVTDNQLQGLCPMSVTEKKVTGALPHVSVTDKKIQGVCPMYLLLTKGYRGFTPYICY